MKPALRAWASAALLIGTSTAWAQSPAGDPPSAAGPSLLAPPGAAAWVSAPLPAQTLEEFREKFGHTILERYGMSETLMNISNPYVGERRPGAVGLPMPGVSIRNLDPDGHPVEDGAVGELHLRGPNLFAGYWRRPEATAAAFRDGLFKTGDIAVRSTDGYYTLQGRRSDLIISGGFNIYPREIEDVIAEVPGVAEVAVVGVNDAEWGQHVTALLTVAPGASVTVDDVLTHCRSRMASYKKPKDVRIVDSFPLNSTGKIAKKVLREQLNAEAGQ